MRRIDSLILLSLFTCASIGMLFGGPNDPAPADRKAPLDQYGAVMIQSVRDCIARGNVVEAHWLVEDLQAAKLSGAQQQDLSAVKSQLDAIYRPDGEDSLYNDDVLVPAKDFNGKYGYIDQTGKFVIPGRYTTAEHFSEGWALVEEQKGQPKYFIDRTGTKVLEVKPSLERYFYDQDKKTIWMVRDGKDSQEVYDGSFAIPLDKIQIDAMGGFHNGLARCDLKTYQVQLRGAYTQPRHGTIYIDKTGKEKLFFPSDMFWISDSDFQCYDFSEGRASILRVQRGDRLWGYVDTTGKWIQEPTFKYAGEFFDGMAAIMYPNTKKWGFIDANGAIALKPFYQADTVQCFNEGSLICTDSVNGKFLVIKKDGSRAAEFPHTENPAPDNINQAKGITNRSGDGVILVAWSKGSLSLRGNDDDIVESVIGTDASGKELFALCGVNGKRVYVDEVGDFSNGRSFVRVADQSYSRRESWGLIDTRGNWVVQPTKAWIPQNNFSNGLAKVKMADDGAIAYMDRSGNIVYKE